MVGIWPLNLPTVRAHATPGHTPPTDTVRHTPEERRIAGLTFVFRMAPDIDVPRSSTSTSRSAPENLRRSLEARVQEPHIRRSRQQALRRPQRSGMRTERPIGRASRLEHDSWRANAYCPVESGDRDRSDAPNARTVAARYTRPVLPEAGAPYRRLESSPSFVQRPTGAAGHLRVLAVEGYRWRPPRRGARRAAVG
jgi:hypothetical protein